MATREKPPRLWRIDDLLVLGTKSGATHLKAIPVLILEKWVEEGREEQTANHIRTTELANRLVSSGLVHPYKPKGTSKVLAGLTAIQKSRNLTRPSFIEYKGAGMFWINLPHYEPLLQEYRKKYREQYPRDYKRLFPEGEPEWESLLEVPATHRETKPMRVESEIPGEIKGLLAPIEQALRDRQQAIEKLTVENQKQRAELVTLQAALKEEHESPHRRIMDEELRNDCAKLLENKETYIDAIRRAGVVLEERLRKTIRGDGSEKFKEGVDLVDYALLPKFGRLIISDHPSEQDGVRMLFRGALQFVRNPPAHKKVQYTELEAWQTINLIDYLLLLLRQAKSRET